MINTVKNPDIERATEDLQSFLLGLIGNYWLSNEEMARILIHLTANYKIRALSDKEELRVD